jgi:hypothetical protein
VGAHLQMYYTFKVTGGCKLRGKAGEVRWFGPVIVELWRRHMHPGKELHCLILRCLECSVRMEMILEEHANEVVLPGM